VLCHGDTPGRYALQSDRSVSLLFGDAGSATAIEAAGPARSENWFFSLHTEGSGFQDMIIEGGAFRERFPEDNRKFYVQMNGANVFNFTIQRLPPLIRDTLQLSGCRSEDVDYYIFHQSNQFILRHVMKKMEIPDEKVPMTLKKFGNPGGPSVPLTITRGELERPVDRPLKLMLLGYGVGLSWASAFIELEPDAILGNIEI
jgi:3-oxoacyl-[acyl-carrier-protein] synthase-3